MNKKYLFGTAAALLLLSSTTSTALAATNYTVKSGDTLFSISRATNVAVSTLKTLNSLKNDAIYVGQKLNLAAVSKTTKPTTSTATNTVTSTYKVKAGDTLFKIATAYKTTVANLTTWNNLKSTSITVGQSLVVGKSTTTTTSTSSTTNTSSSTNTSTNVTVAKTYTGTVTASSLNVRATASTSGKLVGSLSLGKSVTITNTVQGWYYVNSGNVTGWVSSSYIKLSSTSISNTTTSNSSSSTPTSVLPTSGVVTASSLNLRATASATSTVLFSIPNGKTVTISGQSGDWYKVTYSGINGWVSKSYIKPNTTASNTNSSTAVVNNTNVSNKAYEVRANGGLNLRSGASSSSSVLTVLPNGAKLTMVELGTSWHKVKYGNYTGYVSSAYVGEVTTSFGSTSTTTNTSNSGLTYRASNANHLVVLDPGHGGVDPGAVNGKHYESNYVIDIASKTKAYLESIGYKVLLTRTNSSCVVPYSLNADLQCRVNLSNNNDADAFVSIHINSAIPGAIGAESYYSANSTAKAESIKLANEVHSEYQPVFGSTDRGIKSSDFYVLRYNHVPSTLVEVGFISDSRDLARLNDPTKINNVAKAIAKGIDDYFN